MVEVDEATIARQELSKSVRDEVEQISDIRSARNGFIFSVEFQDLAQEEGLEPQELAETILVETRAEILSEKFSGFFEQEFGLTPGELLSKETDVEVLTDALKRAPTEAARLTLNTLIVAREKDLSGADLRREFELEGKSRLGDPDDLTDIVFTDILRSPDLRRKWLSTLYDRQLAETQSNLDAIDEAALEEEVLKEEIVIVGGGPLTSVAASILALTGNKVTVITDQESVGEPWLHRPIYLNSPVEQSDLDSPRVPLQENSTTSPITPAGFINVPDIGELVNDDALTKICDVKGVRRKYPSGPDLGAAVATNIAYYTENYLVGQSVRTDETTINDDGSVRLTFEGKDGVTRQLDAKKVLFLTGPGKDILTIEDDASTQEVFEDADRQIDQLVETVRESIKNGEEPPQVADLIPKVLTLSRIQRLYRLWDVDLKADPNNYPFKNLLQPESKVIYAGKGDTTLTALEVSSVGNKGKSRADTFLGPPEFYPEGAEGLGSPQKIVVGDKEFTSRRRYADSVEEDVELIDGRIEAFDVLENEERTVVAFVRNKDGSQFGIDGDYLIYGGGLDKTTPQEAFGALNLEKQIDFENNVVGYTAKEAKNKLLIGGSATKFKKADFPEPIANVIDKLGIGENTIALWVHALLTERLIWNNLELTSSDIDTQRIQSLVDRKKQK